MAIVDYAFRILADAASGFHACRRKIGRMVAEDIMADHHQELHACVICYHKSGNPREYTNEFEAK